MPPNAIAGGPAATSARAHRRHLAQKRMDRRKERPGRWREISLDMESITDTDLADAALNRILVAHLKSEDFFDTARHPTATFALHHVTLNPQAHPAA